MKRILSLLVVVFGLVGVLAACGSDDAKESSSKETLVIGIDDKFAPMGFRDDNNEIVGFDIDMAKAAAKKMDVEVEFQPIDWSTKESELSSGRIDLIWNGYTITDERKEKVLYSKPYLANAQVILTLEGSDIKEIKDLAGKEVGLQGLSSAADSLAANPVSDKVKKVTEFKDNVSALNDLKSKRLDAVVIDKIVAEYYMTKENAAFVEVEESLSPEEFGVGIKKGNTELQEKLQNALDEMNEDGTAAKISKTWFGEDRVLK